MGRRGGLDPAMAGSRLVGYSSGSQLVTAVAIGMDLAPAISSLDGYRDGGDDGFDSVGGFGSRQGDILVIVTATSLLARYLWNSGGILACDVRTGSGPVPSQWKSLQGR